MTLRVGQLLFTSFFGKGFQLVTSDKVPEEVKAAFRQHIVNKYWNTYFPLQNLGKAAYIHQISQEQTLFGWLFNDGVDEFGRSGIPYFISYYFAEKLSDFHLSSIFDYLEEGPLELVERQTPPLSLKGFELKGACMHPPIKKGVRFPKALRSFSLDLFANGSLLDFCLPEEPQHNVEHLTHHQPIDIHSTFSSNHRNGTPVTSKKMVSGIPTIEFLQPVVNVPLQTLSNAVGSVPQIIQDHISESIPAQDGVTEDTIKIYEKRFLGFEVARQTQITTTVKRPKKQKPDSRHTIASGLEPEKTSQVPQHQNLLGQGLQTQFKSGSLNFSRFFNILIWSILMGVPLSWAAGLMGSGLWQSAKLVGLSSPQTNPKLLNSFAQVQNLPTGVFNYGGSTAWSPLRLIVDAAIQAERPEFQLRYLDSKSVTTDSSKGIQMLLNDQLAFAQSSRPLGQNEYDQAKQRGFKLKQIPVAINAISIAIDPDLTIPGLTLDQLRSIYSGQIVNWEQVGGPNLEIIPYSRPVSTGGTVAFFMESVLQGQEFGPRVEFIPTTTEGLRKLTNRPGGIYYASAPAIVPQCKIKPVPIGHNSGELVLPYLPPVVTSDQCPKQGNHLNLNAFKSGQYPITHFLYVVIKQNGRIEEHAGEAYANFLLTAEGQALITKTGAVPLH